MDINSSVPDESHNSDIAEDTAVNTVSANTTIENPHNCPPCPPVNECTPCPICPPCPPCQQKSQVQIITLLASYICTLIIVLIAGGIYGGFYGHQIANCKLVYWGAYVLMILILILSIVFVTLIKFDFI